MNINGHPRIFFSYARSDDEFARKLTSDLSALGFEPWLDQTNLSPGENWEKSILTAIRDSDYIFLLLSSNSIKSEWVRREVEAALRHHPKDTGRLVPVLLDRRVALQVPSPLNKIQWLDLSEPSSYKNNLLKFAEKAKSRRASSLQDVKPGVMTIFR